MYDAEDEKNCRYCAHATSFAEEAALLCKYKGTVEPDGCCSRFSLDLLKLEPRRRLPFQESEYDLLKFEK